jgi:hypothetical protein
MVVESAGNEIRSKAVPFGKALLSQRIIRDSDYLELSGLLAYIYMRKGTYGPYSKKSGRE